MLLSPAMALRFEVSFSFTHSWFCAYVIVFLGVLSSHVPFDAVWISPKLDVPILGFMIITTFAAINCVVV